jgi:hypothetical protein
MEDISSFLGPSPAPEVKRALPLIAKLEQKDLRALLPKALQYLKGEDLKDADISSLQLKDQGYKKPFSATWIISDIQNLGTAPVAFTGLYLILRAAIKSKSKIEV